MNLRRLSHWPRFRPRRRRFPGVSQLREKIPTISARSGVCCRKTRKRSAAGNDKALSRDDQNHYGPDVTSVEEGSGTLAEWSWLESM